jgi:hypothetical protein
VIHTKAVLKLAIEWLLVFYRNQKLKQIERSYVVHYTSIAVHYTSIALRQMTPALLVTYYCSSKTVPFVSWQTYADGDPNGALEMRGVLVRGPPVCSHGNSNNRATNFNVDVSWRHITETLMPPMTQTFLAFKCCFIFERIRFGINPPIIKCPSVLKY